MVLVSLKWIVMSEIPLTLTCPHCRYERHETLQRAIAGKLDPPLWCPDCGMDLDLDWEWIYQQAETQGLIPPSD